MYVDYSTWEVYEYKLSSLFLDLNNPRIKYKGVTLNQTQILKHLISKEKVYELAKKISEEGYFVGEEPIICIENNKKIVLEGNRRTSALKLLQDPKKYLSSAKASILINNIKKNNFPVDNKLKCYIAPNRLMANPIIYSRHSGTSLERWKTGNQYSFVAEMYFEDGLSLEDICDVLNESKAKIIKPLKAYNLFFEGKTVLEKERNIIIEIAEFDFTNLERFYGFDEARNFLGIAFNEEDGELIIKIERDEFEKRLLEIFIKLIDAERFSRDFNKDDQKKKYIEDLKRNPTFDFSIKEKISNTKSKSAESKSSLEEQKRNTTTRRKANHFRRKFENSIIHNDEDLNFDNDKLYDLFMELKSLPIDKKYSFAILLRTFLEQAMFFYLDKKLLLPKVGEKGTEERKKNGIVKVDTLIRYLQGKYSISAPFEKDQIMNILKFDADKNYSSSLKAMLDYIRTNELEKFNMEPNLFKATKQYLDNVKNELDLSVHNLNYSVDVTHNKRAWNHLFPLLQALARELENEE